MNRRLASLRARFPEAITFGAKTTDEFIGAMKLARPDARHTFAHRLWMEFPVVVDSEGIHLWSGRGELQPVASFGWSEMSSLAVNPDHMNLAPIGNGPVHLVIGGDPPRGRIPVAFRVLVEDEDSTTHREMNLLHFTQLFGRIRDTRSTAEPMAMVTVADAVVPRVRAMAAGRAD